MSIPVIAAKPRKGIDIDNKAYELIKKFQSEVLKGLKAFDVESFFEFDLETICDIKTNYIELPAGVYGITDSERKVCCVSKDIIEKTKDSDIYFARSTIAHEIYHALVHVPEFRKKRAIIKSINNDEHVCLYRQEDLPVYRNPEWQAFRFAGALLMPEAPFKAAIKDGANEYDLSSLFEVNPANIRSRARALKISLK